MVETIHREGSLYVAKPGNHLPEPQVDMFYVLWGAEDRLIYSDDVKNDKFRKFQSPEDLHIFVNEIEDNKFHLSLFANHQHAYSFQTPDCPFLTLTSVTPYGVDCVKDQNNLTMCNRSDFILNSLFI